MIPSNDWYMIQAEWVIGHNEVIGDQSEEALFLKEFLKSDKYRDEFFDTLMQYRKTHHGSTEKECVALFNQHVLSVRKDAYVDHELEWWQK